MAKSQVCVLCLIGLPGAGKTYLAKEIIKSKFNFSHVEHICYDELIKWHGNSSTWRNERKSVYKLVESKVQEFIFNNPIGESLLIVLDDNMYYKSMRYELYQLCRKYRVTFGQIFLNTPIHLCLERNENRLMPLPANHILNMSEKLECPSPSANNWEKDTLIMECSSGLAESLDMIKSLIISASLPSEIEKPIVRDSRENVKHTADIALRKTVSLLVNEVRCFRQENIADKVQSLNKRRKEILDGVCSGEIYLPVEQNIDVYIQYFIPFFNS